jgi:hypothetical protein
VHRRTPVVIFLSDEEGHVNDVAMFHICRDAVYLGFVNLRHIGCVGPPFLSPAFALDHTVLRLQCKDEYRNY